MKASCMALCGLVLLGACSPAPQRLAPYRLEDGSCVNFSNLPPNWKRRSSPDPGTAVIVGEVDGAKMAVAAYSKPLTFEEILRWLGYYGWFRFESEDVPGFQAWAADDGEVSYIGQKLGADNGGPQHVALCIYVRSEFLRKPNTCKILDRTFEPRRVEMELPWSEMGRASVLLPKAEAAFDALGQNCPP